MDRRELFISWSVDLIPSRFSQLSFIVILVAGKYLIVDMDSAPLNFPELIKYLGTIERKRQTIRPGRK